MILGTNPATFEGVDKNIGVFFDLIMELVKNNVYFRVCIERVSDYIITNYKNGGDIKVTLSKILDPNLGFNGKHNPTSLANE